MPLLDAEVVRLWLLGGPARWPLLIGCVVVAGDGARKRVAAVTSREVVFGRAGDFVARDTLCRKFSGFVVGSGLAARIARDLRAEEEAAAKRAEVRRLAEAAAAARTAEEQRRKEAHAVAAAARAEARRLAEEAALARAEEERQRREAEAAHRAQQAAEHARLRAALPAILERWRAAAEHDRTDAGRVHKEALPHLRSAVAARGLTALFHFTQTTSLALILREGIKPQSELPEGAAVNDRPRHDYATDAVSLSVSFPNYRVFSRFREKDRSQPWVVLRVSPEVLFERTCLFNPTNASSSVCARLARRMRATPEAFERMFADEADWVEPSVRRELLGLPPHFPTDPQAEILAVGTVPAGRIEGVAFESGGQMGRWAETEPQLAAAWRDRVAVASALFAPRADHGAWSGAKPLKTG